MILPHHGNLFREKVRAAVHTLNGFGQVVGFEFVRELGLLESPIALTNTLNVGRVADALVEASGGPAFEGGVGAGTGTSCFGWKGGIGTGSRRVPVEAGGFTVGALVQSNFGRPEGLTILGVPVGRRLRLPEAWAMGGPWRVSSPPWSSAWKRRS